MRKVRVKEENKDEEHLGESKECDKERERKKEKKRRMIMEGRKAIGGN